MEMEKDQQPRSKPSDKQWVGKLANGDGDGPAAEELTNGDGE